MPPPKLLEVLELPVAGPDDEARESKNADPLLGAAAGRVRLRALLLLLLLLVRCNVDAA